MTDRGSEGRGWPIGMVVKVETLELHHARLPLREPFRTAFGTALHNDVVFVRLGGEGSHGWGESAPGLSPGYSPEWAGGAFATIREVLAPLVVGRQYNSPHEVQARMASVKANYFAKAAIDLALWDLVGRLSNTSVRELIGGVRPAVEAGEDFGIMETHDELLARIEQGLAQGARRIKLKAIPGWDVEMLEAVRGRFPDAVVHVDCNAAYSLRDVPRLKEFDHFGLAMIEQPLASDDLLDHARLQSELKTDICLDESITSLDKARKAIDIGACRWVNLKTGRVGGLTNAIDIHDLCSSRGVPCWVGFSIESALGQAQNMALASLPNNHYPADVFPSGRFHADDVCAPRIGDAVNGLIVAPAGPGFGCEPRRGALEAVSIASWSSG